MSSSDKWPCAALRDADLSARTTMRVGGTAEWLLEPADPEELREAWLAARARGLEPRMLGGGANLIVEGGRFPGAVISTARMRRIFRPGHEGEEGLPSAQVAPLERERDPRLVAWCGATLPALVRAATKLGWSGIEGLVGVPGTLGGGIAMNAGGRWGDLWDVVQSVRVLAPDGELRDLERADCRPAYRNGNLGENVLVGAVLGFAVEKPADVQARADEYLTEKNRVQPVSERSSGCIFKNPDPELSAGRSAGKLIDDCGGKRLTRGAARVSPLHGNFIVNTGTATAADVLTLIEDLRDLVAQRTGLRLETEVRIWRLPEPAPRPAAPRAGAGGAP